MHELTLSQSIVDLVVECARNEGVHAITRVVVEVGIAAGVEPDALRFCFDLVAANTLAQGAEFTIDTITLQARCRNCALRIRTCETGFILSALRILRPASAERKGASRQIVRLRVAPQDLCR